MTPPRACRSAGVLLHPTSLPGPYGIGDFGPASLEWIDLLARAGQSWWQILPLGPTGYGDSPYQCFSAFAGNPYLISPELLARDGLLKAVDMPATRFPADRVDYASVIKFKQGVLTRAWENFQGGAARPLRNAFEEFCAREAYWLDDYALFMALKDFHQGANWTTWNEDLVQRRPPAIERARRLLAGGVGRHKLGQFLFTRQWCAVKEYANQKGVRLIGDAPIFVSADSADVWANPDQFLLDEKRNPTVVAGVPPDYFSPTGQLWGNPHYNWDRMRQSGFTWWVARIRKTLEQVDLVRLDHFRGFEAYWEVPAGQLTAEMGHWVQAPGVDFFNTLRYHLGGLPIIAEDLGLITPEVERLREQFGLPGMRILQFAFSGSDNRFLPHHFDRNTVVYTGTHDNDTTVGWYHSLPEGERQFLNRYLPGAGRDIAWELMRMAFSSVADYALVPAQDLLSLPTEARMNYPGRAANNWTWRCQPGQIDQAIMDRLGDMTALYSRS
ncbi:MAG: 4-alpha-glucanotransferase [Gemmataceae bacterium]